MAPNASTKDFSILSAFVNLDLKERHALSVSIQISIKPKFVFRILETQIKHFRPPNSLQNTTSILIRENNNNGNMGQLPGNVSNQKKYNNKHGWVGKVIPWEMKNFSHTDK